MLKIENGRSKDCENVKLPMNQKMKPYVKVARKIVEERLAAVLGNFPTVLCGGISEFIVSIENALLYTSGANDTKTSLALIQAGAPFNAQYNDGTTPLICAANNENIELFNALYAKYPFLDKRTDEISILYKVMSKKRMYNNRDWRGKFYQVTSAYNRLPEKEKGTEEGTLKRRKIFEKIDQKVQGKPRLKVLDATQNMAQEKFKKILNQKFSEKISQSICDFIYKDA